MPVRPAHDPVCSIADVLTPPRLLPPDSPIDRPALHRASRIGQHCTGPVASASTAPGQSHRLVRGVRAGLTGLRGLSAEATLASALTPYWLDISTHALVSFGW